MDSTPLHKPYERLKRLVTATSNVIFGDPSAERFDAGSMLNHWLSVVVDGSVTTVTVIAAAFLMGWCIPSTYVFKRKYLRFVASSKLISRVEAKVPYIFLALLYVWIREYRRSAALAAKLQAHRRARGLQNDSNTSVSRHKEEVRSDRLLASTVRKYRSGFGLWCVACVPAHFGARPDGFQLCVLPSLLLFVNRAYYMVKGNAQMLIDLDKSAMEREIISFRPPSVRLLDMVTYFYRSLFSSVMIGLGNIPVEEFRSGRPLLFVSNHPILGFEFPLLLSELYKQTGIFLRALTDHSHWQIPVNAQILRDVIGAAEGTQRNVDLLLSSGAAVLVYPGGARETFKRVGEPKYMLHWEGRLGFARAAIRHGCTIIPCTSVGTEDMTTVLYDMPLSWIPIPYLWRGDRTLPIVKIPGLQDLQRIYFCFGEPIRTSQYNGNWENVKFCEEVRDKTKASVEQGIRFLQHVQEADPQRLTINRSVWLRRVAGLFQDMSKTNVNADDAEDSTSSSSRKV